MKNIITFEEHSNGITMREFLLGYELDNDYHLYCQRKNLLDLIGVDIFDFNYISCWGNKLSNLKGVENLTNLDTFWCHKNNITSLDGVENLINLRELDCSYNVITTLKGIENLINLKEFSCEHNPIDWVDYIDKKGNTWYIELPKSITYLDSDKFSTIEKYWNFMNKNQPASVSRKFNF